MQISRLLIVVGAALSITGVISAPFALALGILIALIFGNPVADKTKLAATWLMAIAIVGLGAGIPLKEVLSVGAHGIVYTVLGIGFTFLCGLMLGGFLKLSNETSLLITSGTAICGGSAIAAISRVIEARQEAIAISLVTVFILNAIALILFPIIGHALDLTQSQFGLWAGLAIHDTSSVIGAALQYGSGATDVATTTKLARAIWIIPLAFIIGFTMAGRDKKIPVLAIAKRCWFIAGFLLMACIATYVPDIERATSFIAAFAKDLMALVLFLIGLGLTKALLKEVGVRPFIQGAVLWIIVSAATLAAILAGWISL